MLHVVFLLLVARANNVAWALVTESYCSSVLVDYTPHDPPTPNDFYSPDVLIVGSGWAGISAGRTIQKYNDHVGDNPIEYVILEGDDEIGGRSRAAHWVAGGEGNPLAEFVWRKFNMNELLYETQQWSNIEFYNGDNGGPIRKKDMRQIANEWEDAYTCLQEEAFKMENNDQYQDASIRETLSNKCNWNLNDIGQESGDLKRLYEWYALDYEFAQTPEHTSTQESFPDPTYFDFQDKSWFISDSNNCAKIAKRVAEEDLKDDAIKLNYAVCHIDVSGTTTKVYACNDSLQDPCHVFTPKKVISTVSQGYLANYATDLFSGSNALQAKWDAMRSVWQEPDVNGNMGMPLYKEIKFQFNSKWWGDEQFIFITGQRDVTLDDEDVSCNIWQSYNTRWSNEFFFGSNTLVCVLTTEVYDKLLAGSASLDNNKIRDLLKNSFVNTKYWNLGVKYYTDEGTEDEKCQIVPPQDFDLLQPPGPSEDRACKVQYFSGNNDYWKGSYENWKIGGTKDDFDTFIEPLAYDDSLMNATHFAGSATCYRYWGFQHGAYYSGIRAATQCVKEIVDEDSERDSIPETYIFEEQFCEDDPSGGPGNLFIRPPKTSM